MGPLLNKSISVAESDYNPRPGETDYAWSQRIAKTLTDKIQEVREKGASANRILLLMPPKFLEKIYSITFACTRYEAQQLILDELKKNGFIGLYGACVISNESVLYPDIQVLGDLRQAQKEARVQEKKMFGGKPSRRGDD